MVSFNKSRPGYVGWEHLSVANDFKVSLRFKTNEQNGLIFYVTDRDQSNGISLSLVDGHLKVLSQKTELVSTDTFNDSDWHVVSVIHNHQFLRVDFDDYGNKVYVLIVFLKLLTLTTTGRFLGLTIRRLHCTFCLLICTLEGCRIVSGL